MRATDKSCSMPVIPAISVILPLLSTAILPDAKIRWNGHLTGMDLKQILARIERRLVVVGMSANRASLLAGKPDAIRNIRRTVKNDSKGGFNAATIAALAGPLQTTPAFLLDGIEGVDSLDPREVNIVRLFRRAPEGTQRIVETVLKSEAGGEGP